MSQVSPRLAPIPEEAGVLHRPGPNPLVAKLEHGGCLTDADRTTLSAVMGRRRLVAARCDLIRAGDRPENVFLIARGFACRYKLLADGRRQIMALLVPGDFCDLHVAILDRMDHSIATLTPCEIVEIPRPVIVELTQHHPRITGALWWATLVEEAILREWLASIGQRDADQRMAHLFCELLLRLQTVGLATRTGYDFPLRQTDLADIFGLSSVHANRTLQRLRGEGLIMLRSRQLEIPDVERLQGFCDFDPIYLHLTPRQDDDTLKPVA